MLINLLSLVSISGICLFRADLLCECVQLNQFTTVHSVITYMPVAIGKNVAVWGSFTNSAIFLQHRTKSIERLFWIAWHVRNLRQVGTDYARCCPLHYNVKLNAIPQSIKKSACDFLNADYIGFWWSQYRPCTQRPEIFSSQESMYLLYTV